VTGITAITGGLIIPLEDEELEVGVEDKVHEAEDGLLVELIGD
jgi:hypothetical protein